MLEINETQTFALIAGAMFLIGFGIAWLLYAVPLTTARERLIKLQAEHDAEKRVHEARQQLHEESVHQMQHTFSSLSRHALQENNNQFLQLANETFSRFQQTAESNLDGKSEAFQEMVSPIKKALDETRSQVHQIEKERQLSFGQVSQQLKGVVSEQQELRQQTQKLVTALKKPEVRGQWGEITLKRIVEMAGMVDQCDFSEQVHNSMDGKVVRPDLIVRMPDKRELIIDAKAPLEAYLEAAETDDPKIQKEQLQRHAKILRNHVMALSAKKYWEQFENAPDFVILFVPGEQFLSAALENDKKLLNDAMDRRIILASPTTLIALLRSVSYGWKQVLLSENASKVQKLGEDVHRRMTVLIEHLERLGKSLNSSVEHYNKTLGSLERTVMPGFRRFSELGVGKDQAITEIAPIESQTRPPMTESPVIERVN